MVSWGRFLLTTYCRQQSVLALSSPEAEYYAAVSLLAEMLHLKNLFEFLGIELPIHLEVDASSAIAIASRMGVGRIRHLDTKYLWAQQIFARRQATLSKISGKKNVADLGTKHVDAETLKWCCQELGFLPLSDETVNELSAKAGEFEYKDINRHISGVWK